MIRRVNKTIKTKNSLVRFCEENLADVFTDWNPKTDLEDYFHSESAELDKLVKIALSNDQPLAWRSAWFLDQIITRNDNRLDNHIGNILDSILDKKDGHQRQLLRLLERVKLTDEQEGRLFDICMTIWEQIGKIPSVRHFAFVNMLNMVKKYPDLINEMEYILQDHYTETLSPGIKHSILKAKKKLLSNN